MLSRISLTSRAHASRLRLSTARPAWPPSPSSAAHSHNASTTCLKTQFRSISGGHSGAFKGAPTSVGGRRRGRIPLAAIGLIGGGLAVTAVGLWQFYTSNVNNFPQPIRDDLRKALYYQNYGNDPNKAVDYYRTALEAALVHEELSVDGPEVTGIMIQFGTLLQDLDRTREAIEVLTACFECLVHGKPLSAKYDQLQKKKAGEEAGAAEVQDQQQQQQQEQEQEVLSWHGVEDVTVAVDVVPSEESIPKQHHASVTHLDGPTRLKTIGVAQKLGDLHHSIKQDKEAERFYVWSVEQLLRDYGNEDAAKKSSSGSSSSTSSDHFSQDREQMKKQFDFDNLPSWMSQTDLGASIEALAGFYAKKGQYRNALALYMRALGLSDSRSCHASVIMCNISDSFAGLGRLDDAVQWAQKGLDASTSQTGQECDESCGVILYNLGMLNEMKGNMIKAEEYYKKSRKHGVETGFKDCVLQSNKALKRLKEGTR